MKLWSFFRHQLKFSIFKEEALKRWRESWRGIIIAGLFLFIWNVVPTFATPLYYYMTDGLRFSQQFIGDLGAFGSMGAICGAILYTWLSKRVSLKVLLYTSIATGTVCQLSYALMTNETSAIIISAVSGLFGMFALVSSLTVAAHASPIRSAGFTYAILMSVLNGAEQLSSNIGASLYTHVFHHHLHPLIYIAAFGTALGALAVPMLKLKN